MPDLDVSLKQAMTIPGAVGAALVDGGSGMTLGTAGGGSIDLMVAAAGTTDVVRAEVRTMKALGLTDRLEDVLITLGQSYHLVRPVTSASADGLFLYLVLDRQQANLAMARLQLRRVEQQLEI